jgi:hypothetical protein
MKKQLNLFVILLFIVFFINVSVYFVGCDSNSTEKAVKNENEMVGSSRKKSESPAKSQAYLDSIREVEKQREMMSAISDDLLGVYEGTQPKYFDINNQMIPPLFFFFKIGSSKQAELEMATFSNDRYYFSGTYKVLEQDDEKIVLDYSVRGGDERTTYIYSGKNNLPSPITERVGNAITLDYKLTINKKKKTGLATRENYPEFKIKKVR